MATAQLQRNKTTSETWSSIFSSSEQLSEQKSALFVKKLLAVAVSSVTYLRAVFPERCFGDRCLEDLNLKILRDEDAYPGSRQVIHWVKGCFDAIDRKYLRKLILGFYINPKDPDTVIETYTFKFDYFSEGINIYRNGQEIASAQTAGDTKRATIRLLRTLVLLTQTLKSLPDDVMMTMKILYYDDVTPSDYQPPGFKETDYSGPHFTDEPFKVSVGDVSTPFHIVGLRVQSELHQLETVPEAEEEEDEELIKTGDEKLGSYLDHDDNDGAMALEKENIPQRNSMTQDEQYDLANGSSPVVSSIHDLRSRSKYNISETINDDEEQMECSVVPNRTPNIPGPSEAAAGLNTRLSTPATPADEEQVAPSEEIRVLCSCGYDGDDGLMILCGICDTWQHGSCYCCFIEEQCPSLHICVLCAKKENNNKKCTDESLPTMDPISLQSTCLWRRALVACEKSSRITAPAFSRRLGVELTVAQGLMKRMQKEGFLRNAKKGKSLGKLVNKEKCSIANLQSYFNGKSGVSEKTTDSERTQNDKTQSMETEKDDTVDNKDIQSMVNKAAQIDISGTYRTRSEKASQEHEHGTVANPEEKNGSRKRVYSSIDKDVEFSISDSQDPIDQVPSPRKKRKASVAAKAILI